MPDVYGVFKYVVDYSHRGYSYIKLTHQVRDLRIESVPELYACAYVAALRARLPRRRKTRARAAPKLSTPLTLPSLPLHPHPQVPVRPFKHNEYERFLVCAYPYYASALSMMAGFFVLGFYFLYTK